jgi:transcriptional regulator with XRE-family HTH domain
VSRRLAGKALENYAETARADEMREIAHVALARGLNQETLAAELGVAPSTVGRHFDSGHPRDSTLLRYANKLQISMRQLRLARGDQLDDRELHEARRLLLIQLRSAEPEFEAGAIDKARATFDKLPSARQRRMLSALSLATDRFHAGILKWHRGDWPLISPMVEAWARQLLPDYDLLAKRRRLPKPPGETLLRDVYRLLTVNHWMAPSQANYVLELVRAALRSFGADIRSMDAYLSSDKLTYRPGRLDQPRHVSLEEIRKPQESRPRKGAKLPGKRV